MWNLSTVHCVASVGSTVTFQPVRQVPQVSFLISSQLLRHVLVRWLHLCLHNSKNEGHTLNCFSLKYFFPLLKLCRTAFHKVLQQWEVLSYHKTHHCCATDDSYNTVVYLSKNNLQGQKLKWSKKDKSWLHSHVKFAWRLQKHSLSILLTCRVSSKTYSLTNVQAEFCGWQLRTTPANDIFYNKTKSFHFWRVLTSRRQCFTGILSEVKKYFNTCQCPLQNTKIGIKEGTVITN